MAGILARRRHENKEMVCMKLEAVVLYPSKRDGVDRLQAGSFM